LDASWSANQSARAQTIDPLRCRCLRNVPTTLTATSLAIATALTLLGGCATRPSQKPVAAPSPPLSSWWQQLGDDNLDRLVTRALDTNLTLAAAQAHLTAARTFAAQAGTPFRPSLSASAGPEASPDATHSYYETGVEATWELPLFGREKQSRAAADAHVDAVAANVAAARAEVANEMVAAYLNARAASERARLLQQLESIAQTELHRVRTRVRLGLEAPSAERHALSQLVALQTRATEPAAQRVTSLERMAALLGAMQVESAWIPAAAEARTVSVPQIAATPADQLRARADVQRAEAGVRAAAAALGIAQAELYPHISLVGALTAAVRIGGGALGVNSVLGGGPAISIPLFDWGMRVAARDARAAELQAATLEYRQTVIAAAAEVETALARLSQATNAAALSRTSLGNDELLAQREAARHRAGLEREDKGADARAIESRLLAVDGELNAGLAFVDLHRALAGAPTNATS
jgi:outer membrane protein TolC